jgi:hypothetical protein
VSRDPRQGGTFALRGYPAGYYVMGVEREGCVTDRFWVRLCGSRVDTLAVALGTPPCDLGCARTCTRAIRARTSRAAPAGRTGGA